MDFPCTNIVQMYTILVSTKKKLLKDDHYLVLPIRTIHSIFGNRIGGVMVSVLASSPVDRGFERSRADNKDNMKKAMY